MNREYHKWWSWRLNRDMELLVFGHAGAKVLVFPTRDGRFHEYEDLRMTQVLRPKLEAGQLQLFQFAAKFLQLPFEGGEQGVEGGGDNGLERDPSKHHVREVHVVQGTLDHGAEVNIVDNYGQTPWSMASGISPVLRYRGLYGNHTTTVALLEGLGATKTTREAMDPNAPPPPGQ